MRALLAEGAAGGLSTRFFGEVFLKAAVPEMAGWAFATAVPLDAVVAGERFMTYKIETTELVGKRPRFLLCQPHERRFNDKLVIHREVQRDVQGFDEHVPTVRITAEIGLADSGHDMVSPHLFGVDARVCQKNHVSAVHEGRRKFIVIASGDGHIGPRQRAGRQLVQQVEVQDLVRHLKPFCDPLRTLYLQCMALVVVKSERQNLVKPLLGPYQTGRTILSTAEDDYGTFRLHGMFLLLICLHLS